MINDHPNWLFLTFCRGGFGHLVGRALMTSPDIWWYDHYTNGEHPWSWNKFETKVGWGNSPGHWIRAFKGSYRIFDTPLFVPHAGPVSDDFFITNRELFNNPVLKEYLDKKYIVVATHENSEFLRREFPNSKIVAIKIEPHDWVNVTKNHIEKSGNHIAYFDNSNNLPPGYHDWNKTTFSNSVRDWQRYNNKQTEEEWIEWTVKRLKKQDEEANQLQYVDYTLLSSFRNNAEELSKIHQILNMRSNVEDIQRVLDNFNYDKLISKYL